jgi:hypothetical protein
MADPGGRPPGPEPCQRKAGKLENWVLGKEFGIKNFAKVLLGADSENLKMRRLPPTCSASALNSNEDLLTSLFYVTIFSDDQKEPALWQIKNTLRFSGKVLRLGTCGGPTTPKSFQT